ncbi:hypothetical protein [Gimesia sp.]|uniref:hypothetical protein n=1 Tax=Gimesia sp. TaxID=2024833 RepID=UPI0032ECB0CE
MEQNLNEQQIKCPKCLGVWFIRSDQAVAVCRYGKCACCLVDDKDEFDPSQLRVFDLKKGVTTRAKAEADQIAEMKDNPVWTADDDLDACGGGETGEVCRIDDVVDSNPDEYQVVYITPWGDELEATVIDKVRMNPGYFELLCPEISEKPFICCKSDIKSARKVTLEPGDRVDIPGDSLSWFDQCVQFIPLTLIASLCSFAAGAAWYRWMERL